MPMMPSQHVMAMMQQQQYPPQGMPQQQIRYPQTMPDQMKMYEQEADFKQRLSNDIQKLSKELRIDRKNLNFLRIHNLIILYQTF